MNEIEMNEAFFGSLKYFCMFIGYPYSGHSLVGAIIDAHPYAVISHECHVGPMLKKGFTRERLLSMILCNSAKFAMEGRKWNNYSYFIPGEWNGRFDKLQVIGDKKGGRSSKYFTKKPEILGTVGLKLGLPVKYIHVMRNPYDMISTLFRMTKNPGISSVKIAVDKFLIKIDRTDKIRKSIQSEDWLDIYYEQLITSPEESIKSLFRFLDLELPQGFVENCRKVIYAKPHKSRFDVTWSEDDIAYASHKLDRYELFTSYTYHS